MPETHLATQVHTPHWARDAIWYQIMIDRFRNANPANDPNPCRPWTSEWFAASPWEGRNGDGFYDYVFARQYGGDLDGLEEKLPYLKDLGVNALYLNPVFMANTHHKYDAINYLHVDHHFGTLGDYDQVAATEDLNDPTTWKWTESDLRFLQFVRAAHEKGIRVIIDGVFNHVGTRHPAFQHVRNHGPSSPFADWFEIHSWDPFDYAGWAGFKELPTFRKSERGLMSDSARRHVFNVTRRWMDPDGDGDPSDGVDGWRLDVPNEIALPFWEEWRRWVKSINPQAYITGEIWKRADAWLDGRHFDSVMNYEFARAAVDWICHRERKIRASEIDRRLAELRNAYPPEITAVLQNLLDSHDTARFVTMALNPDRDYEHGYRDQNRPGIDHAKPGPAEYAKTRLAALLQMTYVGAPMIYYGDEVGMWGADDPTNRKPMLWEDLQPYEKPEENFVMRDHLEYYHRVIALRNAHPALRTLNFETLLTDDSADVWAFRRWDQGEELIVALNASDQRRFIDLKLREGTPEHWRVIFGATDQTQVGVRRIIASIPPISGLVLHASRR